MKQLSEKTRARPSGGRGGMPRRSGCRTASRQGASLVIVVCVSAFLAAFALAMIYTAGLLLSQANQRLRQERSYQLARSFSQALGQQLLQGEKPAVGGQGFYDFVCKFLEDDHYAAYNPDHPESTVYHYAAPGPSPAGEGYGEIAVVLYKESLLETDKLEGSFVYDAVSGQDPLDMAAGNVSRYTLSVEVSADLGGVRCTYTTSYHQQAAYGEDAVVFTAPDGEQLRWKREERRWENLYTHAVYGGDLSGQSIPYEIKPGLAYLESCRFTKTIPEKGEKEEEPGGPEAGGTEETP